MVGKVPVLNGPVGPTGPTGWTGWTGYTGPTGPIGPIGYGLGVTLQGAWADDRAYIGEDSGTPGTHIDAVTYDGSLYLCIDDVPFNPGGGNLPPNLDTAHWRL
jgi:hypothetical protein